MTNGLEQQAPTPEREVPPEAPEEKVEAPSEKTLLEGRKRDAEMKFLTNENGGKLDEKFAKESSEKYPSFEPQYKQALQDILNNRQRTSEEIQAEINELDSKIEAFVSAEEMKKAAEKEETEETLKPKIEEPVEEPEVEEPTKPESPSVEAPPEEESGGTIQPSA